MPPPPLADDDQYSQYGDRRYADLGKDLPRTECLKDVLNRALPYLTGDVTDDMQAGKIVLVAAHGNSLRAIVKHIDCISDEDIAGVNIPTGIPLLYQFGEDWEPIKKGGEYLDPVAAQAAIEAVANQGKKITT